MLSSGKSKHLHVRGSMQAVIKQLELSLNQRLNPTHRPLNSLAKDNISKQGKPQQASLIPGSVCGRIVFKYSPQGRPTTQTLCLLRMMVPSRPCCPICGTQSDHKCRLLPQTVSNLEFLMNIYIHTHTEQESTVQ